jgi:hypothetical protein
MPVHSMLRCATYSFIVVALAGCGDRSGPVEPRLSRVESEAAQASGKTRAALVKRSRPLKGDLVARQTITAAGGTIVIEGAGLIVHFPAGAVSGDLDVSVTAHRGKHVVYSFEPHGARFAQPLTIGQLLSSTTYTRKSEHSPELHGGYLSRGLQDVSATGVGAFTETFAAAFVTQGGGAFVVFQTTHFSAYAVASGNRPAPYGASDAVDIDLSR